MDVSSSPLYCPIRKKWLANLPEERVRINLIHSMVSQLGYPAGNIVVERALSELPHLLNTHLPPKRRTDIIVYGKNIHPNHSLYPLLLIECKSVPLTKQVIRQVIGYNQFVKAFYIGVVNQSDSYFGYFEPEQADYSFHSLLPSYQELISHISSRKTSLKF